MWRGGISEGIFCDPFGRFTTPLSVPALSAACGGSCGALLLLRASLRPRKRQTAAPAPLRLFLPQAAPQLRSPARVGGSPLRRFAPFPLALSRFLRRATAGACKNRSAVPLTASCFCHWQRSLFVPPRGEPSVRPWTETNFVVRQTKTASSVVTIQQKEPFLCPLSLAPLDSSPARVGAKT